MEFYLISKKQIRKLGETIQEQNGILSDNNLFDLEEYRISFKEFLSSSFHILDQISRESFKNAIVTYRIKRFESIINKLIRHPDMCLDRMWDIGGCRCIVNSKEEVYRFKDIISKYFIIRKVNDYYENPQDDGYKSLHLYISQKNDESKIIEIQIRNYVSHNWATLVEITDFLYNEKIKEKKSSTSLGIMLKYLSRYESLSWNEKIDLLRIIDGSKFFLKLTSVFTRNYIDIRKQWTIIEDNITKSYVLISAYTDKAPIIQTFCSFHEAEKAYFDGFDHQAKENRVLTHIIDPRYSKVSIAYSNYVLTYHEFIEEYFSILKDATLESIQKKNIARFAKYFIRYRIADNEYIKNIRREINTFSSIHTKKKGKIEEWANSIDVSIRKRIKQRKALIAIIINKMPRNTFLKIVFVIVFYILNVFLDSKFKRTKI
jgi:putative GTP pyrophosphokinase